MQHKGLDQKQCYPFKQLFIGLADHRIVVIDKESIEFNVPPGLAADKSDCKLAYTLLAPHYFVLFKYS